MREIILWLCTLSCANAYSMHDLNRNAKTWEFSGNNLCNKNKKKYCYLIYGVFYPDLNEIVDFYGN